MIFQKGYHTIAGRQCFNTCLANYLNYNNISVQEYDIYFIGEGYHSFYEKRDGRIIISSTIDHAAQLFMERCGIKFSCHQASDETSARKTLIDSILNEKNISIDVMAKYLSYDEIFTSAGEIGHRINVIGYDDEKDKVYISDGYVPTTNGGSIFEGWLYLSEIIKAWKMEDYHYTFFHFSESSIDVKEIKRKTDFYIKQYFEGCCFSSTSHSRTTDEDIWNKMIIDLDAIFNRASNEEEIGKVMYYINYQLRVDGFMMMRYYILQMMKNKSMDKCIIKEYEDILNHWNLSCLIFVKISFTKNKKQYEKLKCQTQDLLAREKLFIKKHIEDMQFLN